MQKLKLSFIKKMFNVRLTSSEIDFIIYYSKYQDDAGIVKGIHYQDIYKSLERVSHQTFYDVLLSLQIKQIIEIIKRNDTDIDIRFLGNDCQNITHVVQEGYLATNKDLFKSKDFFRLKANEKLLAMQFLIQNLSGNRPVIMRKETLLTSYASLFRVQRRCVIGYLQSLKRFFDIKVNQGKYFITAKQETSSTKKKLSDQLSCAVWKTKVACRRTKTQCGTRQVLLDAAQLLIQYKERIASMEKWGWIPTDGIMESLLNEYQSTNDGMELIPSVLHKLLRSKFRLFDDALKSSLQF